MQLRMGDPDTFTWSQVIDTAIEQDLGIKKSDANYQATRTQLIKIISKTLAKNPIVIKDPKSLSALMPFFLRQLRPELKISPDKAFVFLKSDTLRLINKLKMNPRLEQKAKELEKRFNEIAPKLNKNNQDPKEIAEALKIILTLHLLLKTTEKEMSHDEITLLEKTIDEFLTKNELNMDKICPEDSQQAQQELGQQAVKEGALTLEEWTIILSFGKLPSGTHELSTGPLAESLGMIITDTVLSVLLPIQSELPKEFDTRAGLRPPTETGSGS